MSALETKDIATKVAFVGMVRPIVLDILVRTPAGLDYEFANTVNDVAGMARSEFCTDPKAMVDEVLASFAGVRDQLISERADLIAKLSAQA